MSRATLFGLASLALASAASAGPFDITWYTIDGGGGTVSAGSYTLSGTIGQPDAGTLSAGGYTLKGGFWTGTAPSCPADFNGDGFVDIFDFNDFVTCFEDGICPPGKSADFNGDGFADIFDFNDFVTAFENGC